MRNAPLILAAAAVSLFSLPASAQSATERLQAGEVPFERWSLDAATPSEMAEALEMCIAVLDTSTATEAAELVGNAGWSERPLPEELAPLLAEVADERWEEQRQFYDDEEEFEADRANDLYYNPSQWPVLYGSASTPALIKVDENWNGMSCRILAGPAEEGSDIVTITDEAAGIVDPQLVAGRIQTPHGFAWETADIGIGIDFGNGIGGAFRVFPPIFDHFVPNISVISRSER